MSKGTLGAFLVGMGGGYINARQRAEGDEQRAQQRELTQLKIDDIKQERHDNEMLRGAAAPSMVTDANAGPMPQGQEARMRGQGFATMGDAMTAQQAMDTPEAQDARRQQLLRAQGKGMQALQEEDATMRMKTARSEMFKQIETEGVMGFLKPNLAQAPSVEDIEAGKAGMFQLSGAEAFNKVGNLKIPEGAQGKWQVLPLGNGRKVQDFIVVDKDGKPVSPMSARALEGMYGMSLKERQALDDSRFETGKRFSMQEAAAQQDKAYKDKLLSMKGSGGGGGSGFERMPEAEKVKLQGIKGRIDSINDAITKARAANEFDDTSPNAKALRGELAGLIDQQDAIVGRYVTDSGPAPIPDLKVKPKGKQALGDGRSPVESQVAILQSELAKNIQRRDAAPQGSPDWIRAQADVESVSTELKRAGAQGAPAPSKSAAATSAPAQRPAASMAAAVQPANLRTVAAQVQQADAAKREVAAAAARRASMRGQAGSGTRLTPADLEALQYLNR